MHPFRWLKPPTPEVPEGIETHAPIIAAVNAADRCLVVILSCTLDRDELAQYVGRVNAKPMCFGDLTAAPETLLLVKADPTDGGTTELVFSWRCFIWRIEDGTLGFIGWNRTLSPTTGRFEPIALAFQPEVFHDGADYHLAQNPPRTTGTGPAERLCGLADFSELLQ